MSSKPTILILSGSGDLHADWIEQKLHERGVSPLRFTSADFPTKAEMSRSYSPTGKVETILRFNRLSLSLEDIQSVWNRRYQKPVPHTHLSSAEIQEFLTDECDSFVQDIWNSLDCFWLPAAPAILCRAKFKALQLKLAGELGFELPPTLISNSPDDFIEFYNQHHGRIISKIAGPMMLRSLRDDFARFTEIVSNQDVAYAQDLRYCPVIFQAYVPKRVELRITVVGQTVLAAEIHSQQTHHTRHDWRHYDYHNTVYLPHNLPEPISQQCVQLTNKLGLCYGAIDMVLTPDDRYVFLEINPNGQFLWVEQATGLPISDAMCDLLIAARTSRSLPQVS